MNWTIFDLFYFVSFIITFMIRWPYGKTSRSVVVTSARFDGMEKLGLLLACLGGMVLPLLYLWTPLFNFADYRVSVLSGVLGILISIPATWLFKRSHSDLGRQWSPKLEIREKHRLITSGIYKYVRHPMYSAIFLYGIAQLLLLGNWLVGPSYLAGFGFLYFFRIRKEESLMAVQFGREYEAYMKRTGRLFSWAFLKACFRP